MEMNTLHNQKDGPVYFWSESATGATAAPRSPKPGREMLTTRALPGAQVMPPHWHTVSPEPAQGASPAAASASSMFCMPLAKRCSASASCVPAARGPWRQQIYAVTGTGP